MLHHRPYVDVLPKFDALLTPLFFTEEELGLFKGTNMYGATLDQRAGWDMEWRNVVEVLRPLAEELADKFTWYARLTFNL